MVPLDLTRLQAEIDVWILKSDPTHRQRATETFVPSILANYHRGRKPKIKRDSLLRPFSDETPLAFNVSHSADRILIAVTARATVGIDIEAHRTDLEFDSIARDHFNEAEKHIYRDAPFTERVRLFFDIWTQKEALAKAMGHGLHVPLRQIPTICHPSGEIQIIGRVIGGPEQTTRWAVQQLKINAGVSSGFSGGFSASVVAPAPAFRVRTRNWPPTYPERETGS